MRRITKNSKHLAAPPVIKLINPNHLRKTGVTQMVKSKRTNSRKSHDKKGTRANQTRTRKNNASTAYERGRNKRQVNYIKSGIQWFGHF
jgi:hypothetical protein